MTPPDTPRSGMTLARRLALFGSVAATAARGGTGIATRGRETQPDPLPELYEFEGCAFCRIVREALTELDLDAVIKPCPQGGERFRPEVVAQGGEMQFPYLVDRAANVRLYESGAIVRHLFETWGDGSVPLRWRATAMQQIGSALAGTWRPGVGRRARPSRAPAQPLELFSFEGSPYGRLVRERLCELELPYVLRTVGRARLTDWIPPEVRDQIAPDAVPGTEKRRLLKEEVGRVSIPWLRDPDTGASLGESAAIVDYLEQTYAL